MIKITWRQLSQFEWNVNFCSLENIRNKIRGKDPHEVGEGNTVKILSPSDKGTTPKGKSLLPVGVNSFFLRGDIFWERFGMQESKEEVKKMSPL